MFLSAPIVANFKNYDEQQVRERIQMDRYLDRLDQDIQGKERAGVSSVAL
jgi:hypothetical protein